MRTGLIGLGAMGQGMASQLAAAGYLTAIYNRTHSIAEQLSKQLQVPFVPTISELVDQVELVLICVSADEDVLEVVDKIRQTKKKGCFIVDMSTVSRETAIKASDILNAMGMEFLDAPVSGGVEGARQGKLSMMIGGNEAVLNTLLPVLQVMAKKISYMGSQGNGQATKAVNQIMAAGINQAVTEALAFAIKQQLPVEKVIDVVSMGAAGNWFLDHRGKSMSAGNYNSGFKMALHYKDLKICQKMSEASNMTLFVVEQTLQEYQKLIAQGHANHDISSLFEIKKQ